MKLSDMEILLQQEMEVVLGGAEGDVCTCKTGAIVGEPEGKCECTTAAKMVDTGTIKPPPSISCTTAVFG